MNPKEYYYIDYSILNHILWINIPAAFLLFVVAYLLFIFLPRRVFPQKYSGGGIENIISNILYMLVFIELSVPLLVLLKIFNIITFFFALFGLKLFFVRTVYKQSIGVYLINLKNSVLSNLYDFLDNYKEIIRNVIQRKKEELLLYFRHFNYYIFFKQIVIFLIFVHLVYIIGYRCFISLANPLSDTSQFFEWVAKLGQNQLYWDNKTAGADFYGISVLIFILHKFTQLDTIVLFNVYPLLLITFLFFGIYFVLKRFTISSLIALLVLLLYGSILLGSPLDAYLATSVVTTQNPDIVSLFGLKIYNMTPEHIKQLGWDYVAMNSLFRYFSGMAYEHSSTLYLINLFYLIKAIDTGKSRFLINYTLSLMLVFILHGGGAVELIIPSLFIAINALIFFKLTWSLLLRGLGAIMTAAIFGNGWMLSVLKYGIPNDIGAAAPFLDKLLHNKNATKEIVQLGAESVVIPHITWVHGTIFALAIFFYVYALIRKKRFYFSSFMFIPIGVLIVYFAQNFGLPKLVHPGRSAEYLYIGTTLVLACAIKFFIYSPLRIVFKRSYKKIFLSIIYIALLLSFFVIPHYKDTDRYRVYINSVQYSDIPYFLYKIIQSNQPLKFTIVSYVQEYSKILGKGYIVLANDFVLKYNPTDKYLRIPTEKVYIFVENIPHSYRGMDEWFYRWRRDVEERLKSWVATYAATHNNIKLYAKSKLVTVYEIDNSAYIQELQKEQQDRK